MKIFKKLVLPIAAALLCACSNDDSDKVILLVKCTDRQPQQGQIVRFEIETFTTDGSDISEVRINSFDPENGTVELAAIPAGSSKFSHTWEYPVPAFKSLNVPLEMRFRSVAGSYSQSVSVNLTVGAAKTPDEYSGITLWSPASGRPDGFSLASREAIYTSEAPEETIDIYIPAGSDQYLLERSFRSRTGLRFVKADSFNYGSASAASLNETFTNAIKSNSADDLKSGETILFGRDDKAIGVIRIVETIEADGSANDCITFNIKILSDN